MKKYGKLCSLAAVAFLGLSASVSAKEMTLQEFAEKVKEISPTATDVYVFGNYAFTNSYLLDTQDIMISSRTVNANELVPGYRYQKDVKTDNVYKDMVAYKFKTVKASDFGEITGLTAETNYVGEGKFNQEKIDIQYINYEYIAEEAKYTVEKDTAYGSDYGFEGNDSTLEISDDGIVTGLIKIDNEINENVFSEEEKTGYYLAFDLKVTGYRNDTTIKITGLNEKTFTYASFTDNTDRFTADGVTTLKFLASLNPEKDTEKKITIEVDLDGAGEVYEPTKYVIDWSKATIQEVSEAAFTNEIPEADQKDNEERFGYHRNAKETYALDATGKKMTGTVVKQTLTKDSFGEGKSTGYFITLNVKPKYVTEDIDITYTINDKVFHGKYSDLTDGTLTLILKLKDDASTDNTLKIKIDADGNKNDYLSSEEYEIDLSQLEYAIDTEKVVREFISSLKNTNNKFYDAIYNEDGTATINLKLDSFNAITDIKSTGITGGLYKAITTGDFDKISFIYNQTTNGKHEFTSSDASAGATSYQESGAITTAFNQIIATMMTSSDERTPIAANIAGKNFNITFDLKDVLKDVSGHNSYTIKFTVSHNSDVDMSNLATELAKDSAYEKATYANGVIDVVLENNVTASNNVALAKFINSLLASKKYDKIVINNKDFTYNVNHDSEEITNSSELTKAIKEIMDETKGKGLAGTELTIKLITDNLYVTNEAGREATYTIQLTATANTEIGVGSAMGKINGQDFFTLVPVANEDGKVTTYNILLSDATASLSEIEGTGMMDQLEALLATKFYSEVSIDDITADEKDTIASIKLNAVDEQVKATTKKAITDYYQKIIGNGNITALKGRSIEVTLTLADGVTDENAVDGKLVYTINLDVETVVDSTSNIQTESTAFDTQFYNKYEANEDCVKEGSQCILPYDKFDDTEKQAFYMEIGEYKGTDTPNTLTINGISYKKDQMTLFSVGKGAFLEAPIWTIDENHKILVSVVYMNISALPGTNSLVSIGEQNFDVKLFSDSVESKKLTIDTSNGVTTNKAETSKIKVEKTKDSAGHEIDGEYDINLQYTQNNTAFYFHISDGTEIKGSGTTIYRLDETGIGVTECESDATYGAYFSPYVEAGGAVTPDSAPRTLTRKLAIPGKGVIVLHITVQAVASLTE